MHEISYGAFMNFPLLYGSLTHDFRKDKGRLDASTPYLASVSIVFPTIFFAPDHP